MVTLDLLLTENWVMIGFSGFRALFLESSIRFDSNLVFSFLLRVFRTDLLLVTLDLLLAENWVMIDFSGFPALTLEPLVTF